MNPRNIIGPVPTRRPVPEPCVHSSRTCVRKDASDGSIRFYMQCDKCGSLGGAIRRDDPRTGDAISCRDIEDDRWHDWRAELAKVQKTEDAAWWAQYEAHLRSPEWERRRRLVIEREHGLCQGCRTAQGVQVHHLTYKRMGYELLIDLVLLCIACHEIAHPHKEVG